MPQSSVSVIIPAYNVESYLKAALETIKGQTELPDEVILVNDGSTDATLDVAESFDLPVPYKVISISNSGQGNARNIGVGLASSEYIYFFDSDDLLKKNFISSIKKQIHHNQFPDIILFSGESFNDSEYQGNRWVNYCRGFSGVFSSRIDFLEQAHAHNALFCSPCMYVSKKTIWGPDRLRFGPNFLEDEALFFPLLFACKTFVVLDDIFFLRRNREGSTMTVTPNAKHVNGAMNCLKTTLALSEAYSSSPKEHRYILKKLESHCVAYIVMARRAGLKARTSEVLRVIWAVKSPIFALKAFLFSIRADQSDAVRGIVRMVKRMGGSARHRIL